MTANVASRPATSKQAAKMMPLRLVSFHDTVMLERREIPRVPLR
jgi:hypothetical protein